VDPVDGIANFARQIPHSCISWGYLENGRVMVGAVYDTLYDELFLAERGHGERLNGQPMRVIQVASLQAATVEIGWSTRTPSAQYLSMVSCAFYTGCAVRRAGSSCCAWLTWLPAAPRAMPRRISILGTSAPACCWLRRPVDASTTSGRLVPSAMAMAMATKS